MRRIPAILALVIVMTGVRPASGHFCATAMQVPVGAPVTVTVGVAAEMSPLTGLDVTVPDGFRVRDVPSPQQAWTATVDGSTVRFSGGRVAPFGCAYFTIRGEATRKGRLAFPLTGHAEDGTSKEYKSTVFGDPYSAQLVYAGVKIPDPAGEEDSRGSVGPALIGGGALIAIGLAGIAIVRQRTRREATIKAARGDRGGPR